MTIRFQPFFIVILLLVDASFQMPTIGERPQQASQVDIEKQKSALSASVVEENVQEKESNEIVVDDSKLGSILNIDEKPYFMLLNNEEKSDTEAINTELNVVENNEEQERDKKKEQSSENDGYLKTLLDDYYQLDTADYYEPTKFNNDSINSNSKLETNLDENLSDKNDIQSLIIAFQSFVPIENNDDDMIANDFKPDQLEQNYEMLTNEINTLNIRLFDMEKILIQSFQLNLMIILMFILATSLVLFRVFFMKKRNNRIIFVGNRSNSKMNTGNGEKVPFSK